MKLSNRSNGIAGSGVGRKVNVPKFKHQQLFNPSLSISGNPRIAANLRPFNPVDAGNIRAASLETLNRSVDTINRQLRDSQQFRSIRFSVDRASGKNIAVVTDTRTGRVVRTLPSEQTITLAARLRDASGLLVDVVG